MLVMWGIWLSRNALPFNQRYIPHVQASAQVVSLFQILKNDINSNSSCEIATLQIDKSITCAFAMGPVKDKIKKVVSVD